MENENQEWELALGPDREVVYLADIISRINAGEEKSVHQDIEYICNVCGSKIILKYGDKNRPHFSHKSHSHEPESIEHYTSKISLKTTINARLHHMKTAGQIIDYIDPVNEKRLNDGDDIADIYFEVTTKDGVVKKYAIEVQYSQISEKDLMKRSGLYKDNGIEDIWIFGDRRLPELISINKAPGVSAKLRIPKICKTLVSLGKQLLFIKIDDKTIYEIIGTPHIKENDPADYSLGYPYLPETWDEEKLASKIEIIDNILKNGIENSYDRFGWHTAVHRNSYSNYDGIEYGKSGYFSLINTEDSLKFSMKMDNPVILTGPMNDITFRKGKLGLVGLDYIRLSEIEFQEDILIKARRLKKEFESYSKVLKEKIEARMLKNRKIDECKARDILYQESIVNILDHFEERPGYLYLSQLIIALQGFVNISVLNKLGNKNQAYGFLKPRAPVVNLSHNSTSPGFNFITSLIDSIKLVDNNYKFRSFKQYTAISGRGYAYKKKEEQVFFFYQQIYESITKLMNYQACFVDEYQYSYSEFANIFRSFVERNDFYSNPFLFRSSEDARKFQEMMTIGTRMTDLEFTDNVEVFGIWSIVECYFGTDKYWLENLYTHLFDHPVLKNGRTIQNGYIYIRNNENGFHFFSNGNRLTLSPGEFRKTFASAEFNENYVI